MYYLFMFLVGVVLGYVIRREREFIKPPSKRSEQLNKCYICHFEWFEDNCNQCPSCGSFDVCTNTPHHSAGDQLD